MNDMQFSAKEEQRLQDLEDLEEGHRATAAEELEADEAEAEFNYFYQQEQERDERRRKFAEAARKMNKEVGYDE